MTLLRCLRKLVTRAMAKNKTKRGRSARNGNASAPYTKYNKKPWRYSEAYYQWHRAAKSGKPNPISKKNWKAEKRNDIREFKAAAE